MGMAAGCRGLAIEGNPIHPPFMKLNAQLNGFEDRFTVINSIVGDRHSASGMSFQGQSIVPPGTPGAVTVPVARLDSVFSQHYPDNITVNLGIIDTEGFEMKVLEGASGLVKSRRVAVWAIEVWYRSHYKNVSELPGLQLLLANGYRLFDANLNEIGASAADIKRMLATYCTLRHARAS